MRRLTGDGSTLPSERKTFKTPRVLMSVFDQIAWMGWIRHGHFGLSVVPVHLAGGVRFAGRNRKITARCGDNQTPETSRARLSADTASNRGIGRVVGAF